MKLAVKSVIVMVLLRLSSIATAQEKQHTWYPKKSNSAE